jgi:hypothetical protein
MAYVSDAECSYVIQVKYIILKFTGMPPQQPPISVPPPGHPTAPAPHVNPAFFPPPHGAPPPAAVVSITGMVFFQLYNQFQQSSGKKIQKLTFCKGGIDGFSYFSLIFSYFIT